MQRRQLLLGLAAFAPLLLAGDTRQPGRVQVTAYTWSGQRTASGRWPTPGMCALSRDLERDFALTFGAQLGLEHLGVYDFQDRMHTRWTKRVDLYLPTEAACWRFGIRQSQLVILSPPHRGGRKEAA